MAITYHKKAHKHSQCAKAKRLLNKILKEFQGELYMNIELTGINNIDSTEVKIYVERHFDDLKKMMEQQLLQNKKFIDGKLNEDYEDGYNIHHLKYKLSLIEKLNEVYEFIFFRYPTVEFKQTDLYVFKKEDSQEKYYELKYFLEKNPVAGFNQEYYAVLNDESHKRLYPFTFSHGDLLEATSVYVKFK